MFEKSIDKVFDILAAEDENIDLIKSVKSHFSELYEYLDHEFSQEFADVEFEHLEYGVFLITASLYLENKEISIEMEKYMDSEESLYATAEANKGLQTYFNSISRTHKYIELFDLVEDYHASLTDSQMASLSRNIITVILLAIVESLA